MSQTTALPHGWHRHILPAWCDQLLAVYADAKGCVFLGGYNGLARRSPTGEAVFRNEPGIAVRSAGTSRSARRTISVADIRWADIIFVMEDKHSTRLRAQFRDEVLPVLADVYGQAEAERWLQRWRMFFMAVAELFGYNGGTEWFVSHYRFVNSRGE